MVALSKASWIWYPGDFEVWLGNLFNNRRTERGAMFPPFWKQDSHYPTVAFLYTAKLEREETVTIFCEGCFNLAIDGKLQSISSHDSRFTIPAGSHRLSLKVWNQATPPALFIDGPTIKTNSTWLVTYEDKIWIDENGAAHGAGVYVPAASWCFDCADTPPSGYHLARQEQHPVSFQNIAPTIPLTSAPSTVPSAQAGTLYDFGRETFGYLKFYGLQGSGTISVYYGESREEALDRNYCETLDHFHVNNGIPIAPVSPVTPVTLPVSKAFRYVYIEKNGTVDYDNLLMDYEYAPHDLAMSGSFLCSDKELNDIWDVAAYTMDLTTREFFTDGIKRDRWTWSGDAIQSYLMNYYLHFDTECIKRTIRQLRGKDPVTAHINTIMDYTFYWFKSIYDYYLYTADANFIREMYPLMVTLMDYVLKRTNADGMAEGQPDDWIFVDWVDFPMHKHGILCFEQILLCKALETMALCTTIAIPCLACCDSISTPRTEALPDYAALASALHRKITATFWDNDRHAFLHAIEDGWLNTQITKFPNMFAIIYGLADEGQKQQIMQNVMLNNDVPAITTPYMRFYELEALCMSGLYERVLAEMKAYWGGMLREGATTFWEKYNPDEHGCQHLAMYGRPYGKSLCHAWGASPIYIIGKYFLGVQPTKPGYEEYIVRPVLGGLEWMKGNVPTPFGPIYVEINRHSVTVSSHGGHGILILGERRISIPPNTVVVEKVCLTTTS